MCTIRITISTAEPCRQVPNAITTKGTRVILRQLFYTVYVVYCCFNHRQLTVYFLSIIVHTNLVEFITKLMWCSQVNHLKCIANLVAFKCPSKNLIWIRERWKMMRLNARNVMNSADMLPIISASFCVNENKRTSSFFSFLKIRYLMMREKSNAIRAEMANAGTFVFVKGYRPYKPRLKSTHKRCVLFLN